jgi:hypothetical protein
MLTNINPPVNQVGQGVIQDGLQILFFHLSDIHTLTLKIEEVMKFQRGLSVKRFLEKKKCLENPVSFNSFSTSETIVSCI